MKEYWFEDNFNRVEVGIALLVFTTFIAILLMMVGVRDKLIEATNKELIERGVKKYNTETGELEWIERP